MLALPKTHLLREPGRSACGDLYVADIGVPLQLYQRFGLAAPIFARDPVVPIDVLDEKAFLWDVMRNA
jgi:hypothetical protein